MACTAIIERGWSEGMKASGLGTRVGRASKCRVKQPQSPVGARTPFTHVQMSTGYRGALSQRSRRQPQRSLWSSSPTRIPPLGFYNAVENGTQPQKRRPARRAISSVGTSGPRWASEAPCGTAHHLAINLAINRICRRQIAVAIRLVAPSPP